MAVRSIFDRCAAVASAVSLRYQGSPVYLVGSAIHDPDPRDVDIVVIMPDDLFWQAYIFPEGERGDIGHWSAGTYGTPTRAWQRWARDCAKQAAWYTERIGGPIVDFKTQAESYAKAAAGQKPRRLLSIDFLRRTGRRR